MPDQVRHDGLTDFMDRHYLIMDSLVIIDVRINNGTAD